MNLDIFTSAFSSFFYFGIVLGLAVIFHEWGHFIVGKFVGAKVDEFAVGFGRKLFKFNWHDTEYSIRILPLGGLVKIRGMDPDEELTGAEWEYLQLAPWRRILIVVAGPFMNFVLAYLVYVMVLLAFGEAYTATTTVGQVTNGSMGWQMGLHDGDKILSINGVEVSSWNEVALFQSDSSHDKLSLTIERDGTTLQKAIEFPAVLKEKSEFPDSQYPDSYEGIFVTKVVPGGAADKAGLKAGVSLISIDGNPIEYRDQLSNYVSSSFEKQTDGSYNPKTLTIVYQTPQGATNALSITPELIQPASDAIPFQPKPQLGIVYDGETSIREYLTPTLLPLGVTPKLNPIVGTVKEDSPAAKAGLTKNSRIVEVNGQSVDDWIDVLHAIYGAKITQENEKYTAESLEITWLSPDNQMHTASITPEVTLQNIMTSTSMKTGKRYPLAGIGVDVKSDRKKIGVLGATTGGWNRMKRDCGFMIDFLGKLFTGNVSPRLLGGPIAIYQISGETGRWGWERFLGFIALLSVNLGLLNLFPFPPFDGGHAVVYLVETIRMKPVTMKQMETFGKIGFVLIIPLFIFLIFNDLARTDLFSWVKGLFVSH